MKKKEKVDLNPPTKGLFHINFCNKNSTYSYLFTGIYSGLVIGFVFVINDLLEMWIGGLKYDKGIALVLKWILHIILIVFVTIGVIWILKSLFGWGDSVRECPPSVRRLKKKNVIR